MVMMGHTRPTRKTIWGLGLRRWLRYSAAAWLTFFVSACAGDDPAALCFQVGVYAPANHDPFTGVGFLRLAAEVDGVPTGDASTVTYSPGGGGSVPYVPFGADVQIVVEGWTAAVGGGLGSLLSRGKTIPVDCVAGQQPTLQTVMMTRINAFAQLTHSDSRLPVSLSEGRVGHTVTVTPANEIVIAGGKTLSDTGENWWEPGSPETFKNTLEVIETSDNSVRTHPPMYFPRVWHTATALNTGQLLIAGGYANISGQTQALSRVEVYQPGSPTGASCGTGAECLRADGQPDPGQTCHQGTCQPKVNVLSAELAAARAAHTASLIDENSFTVLFVGGDDGTAGTYEVWNPTAGSTGAKEMPGNATLRHHTATLFWPPGRPAPSVLIAGGEDQEGDLSDAVFVYDAASDRMLELSQKLGSPRTQLSSVWIPSRDFVYVIGGYLTADRTQASTIIDVFDISTQTFTESSGFKLKRARGGHSAVYLGNNSVLMAGGSDGITALDEIEIIYEYVNANSSNNSIVIDTAVSNSDPAAGPLIPYLPEGRLGARAVTAPTGVGLVVGGVSDSEPTMPTSLNFYNPL